jgi:hypothetical protein
VVIAAVHAPFQHELSWSVMYVLNTLPHWRRLAWHTTAFPCRRTRDNVGIRIAINRAMTAITTSSSMSVNAGRHFPTLFPCRTMLSNP